MNRILIGHVLDCLAELPDESVHGIVNSPPYWSLRDYKTEPQIYGDGDCRHDFCLEGPRLNPGVHPAKCREPLGWNEQNTGAVKAGSFCLHCGAWRGSLGLEPTKELYIEHIVEVCRGLRRVLRTDGVFWLNIGDCYNSVPGGYYPDGSFDRPSRGAQRIRGLPRSKDLKPKDLCLIPFRLALALQADGWWVRSSCIWYKRNCMPESASDRPTVDYEFVFLLTKAARYFYDGDAVREAAQPQSYERAKYPYIEYSPPGAEGRRKGSDKGNPGNWVNQGGRNLRTVWDIPTVSYSESHFATFPSELAARCIKVTPIDVCAECGAGYERLTESEIIGKPRNEKGIYAEGDFTDKTSSYLSRTDIHGTKTVNTIGFAPTCTCGAGKARAVVLDPFAGSGTVGQAAHDLGRDFILIELNPDYYEFMKQRLGMFCPEPAAVY